MPHLLPQQGGSCQNQRGLFDCKDGVQCIPSNLKCDCIPHCMDQSDEDPDYAGCVSTLAECKNAAREFCLIFMGVFGCNFRTLNVSSIYIVRLAVDANISRVSVNAVNTIFDQCTGFSSLWYILSSVIDIK